MCAADADRVGSPYGPMWNDNDVIGCGLYLSVCLLHCLQLLLACLLVCLFATHSLVCVFCWMVGLNLRSGEMFWTINGLALPTGFERVVAPNADAYELSDPTYPQLYACVGLQDAGQEVTFNFGKTRFAFKDIDPFYVPTKKAKKTKKKKDDREEGPCSKLFSPVAAVAGCTSQLVSLFASVYGFAL